MENEDIHKISIPVCPYCFNNDFDKQVIENITVFCLNCNKRYDKGICNNEC